MGITVDGLRDVLGMWIGPSGGEGAKQWMNMLTELRNRGIVDVCIVCCDGLKGLPEAITAIWPDATVQTCVVHLVRNSLRYASKAHWQKITGELRDIYTSKTVSAAEERFAEFADRWRDKYPAMIGMWERAWTEFVPFLDYPVEIRKLIYTTNGIVIWSVRVPVLHVRHEGVKVRELRRGSGYLPRSMRQIFRRNDACSAGPLTRLAA